MRPTLGAVLAMSLVLGLTGRAFGAACSLTASELQAKRNGYDATCGAMSPPAGCTTASNHGAYVSCIAHQAKADGTLPKSCRGAVIKCAAKSSCGKAGAVTCCVTKGTKTKCKVAKGTCTPPKGGTACMSTHRSCCDACTATGCASPSGAFVDGTF